MPTNNQFSLTFPEGWKENTVYTFEGPHDSGVQHNLVLVIDPAVEKDIEIAKYAEQQMGNFKERLPGYELVNEKERELIHDIPAYEIVYKYLPADEVVVFQKQIYMIIEGKGYIFTSTFSKKTLKTIAVEVDDVIKSFFIGKLKREEEY